MAVPRLADDRCFLRLDPDEVEDIDDGTTVTTVHERQVVDDDVPTTPRDVPMDRIVTPERTVRTASPDRKPDGEDRDALDGIPILACPRSS